MALAYNDKEECQMKERKPPKTSWKGVWEVWSVGGGLLCSREMRLTKQEALNKVENDARTGYRSVAKPARRHQHP